MNASPMALFCVGSYLVLTMVVALRAFSRTRDSADFFVAGRRLGAFATAMSLFASNLSGFAFVGGPALVYRCGSSSFWMLLCAPVSVVLVFALLARPLRHLAEARGLMTLPEVLALRFRSRAVQGAAAAAVLLGSVAYLAVQLLAMAALGQGLFSHEGEVPALWPFVIGAAALLAVQGALGGALASVATDVLQGVVMIAASAIVLVTAIGVFPGGLLEGIDVAAKANPDAMSPFGTLGPATCFGWFLLFGAGALGQPHYVGRLMMYRRPRDRRRILLLLLGGMTAASLVWILVGVVMSAAVAAGKVEAPARADGVMPLFLASFGSPWAQGLVLAGLLAAIMSSADSLLNVASGAALRDLPRALGRPTATARELVAARGITVVLAFAAAALALWWGDLMGLLGAASWTLFAAALAPALALGLCWRGATRAGALASVVFGTAASILVQLLGVRDFLGANAQAAVFGLSLLLLVLVSLKTRPVQPLDEAVEAVLPPEESSLSPPR